MRPFVLTREADDDLAAIIQFIAQDSVSAAIRVRDEFDAAFRSLAENPGIGHYREELLDQRHKFWRVYSYVIVYRWRESPIQILAVIHGARDLGRQFERRRFS